MSSLASPLGPNRSDENVIAAIEWLFVMISLAGIALGAFQLTTLSDADQDVKLLTIAATTALFFGSYLLVSVLKSKLRR
jgi:hypothetical protein